MNGRQIHYFVPFFIYQNALITYVISHMGETVVVRSITESQLCIPCKCLARSPVSAGYSDVR